MAVKLTSRQQAQLAFLEPVVPKLNRITLIIEQLAAGPVDESVTRQLSRMLDEIKAGAGGLGITGLADSAAQMSTISRRGGPLPMKARALKEGMVVLKINYDQAVKKASTEGAANHDAGE